MTTLSSTPYTYRLILPPWWVRVPIGDGVEEAVATLLDRQFEGLPNDKYGPVKSRMSSTLIETARKARVTGGLDFIFPLGTPWQVPVSAGIVISRATLGSSFGTGADAIIAHLLSTTRGATQVETSAGAAVRLQEEHAATETEVARLRTVRYQWAVPHTDNAILIANFTISGVGSAEFAPIVEALTTLIDTMLGALEWQAQKETANVDDQG